MRSIGVVTTSRADYGVYLPLLRALRDDPEVDLGLYVSGSHLSPEFGLTIRTIEQDGFKIIERVEVVLSSDTPQSIVTSMALGLMGFGHSFGNWKPDILVVLGDRYEMLTVALAALPFKIPVAHLCGGELTEGAIDDPLRHCLTKLSHLHFATTEEYASRVIQLGEAPDRVLVSGGVNLDDLARPLSVSPQDLLERFGLDVSRPYLLVTVHSVTLEFEKAEWQINEILAALDIVGMPVVFTMPNADTAGRIVGERIRAWADANGAIAVDTLGTEGYLAAMSHAAAMVGNSSSGIIEAPSFKKPVVNVGIRQKGRIHAQNVIDVGQSRDEIVAGIRRALDPAFRESLQDMVNPFANPEGAAVETIVKALKTRDLGDQLILKSFYDLPGYQRPHGYRHADAPAISGRWEAGGDFEAAEIPSGPRVAWPGPNAWFASGRDALDALNSHLQHGRKTAVWLPDYFCEDVVSYLAPRLQVRRYVDDPRWQHPDWDTLTPDEGDLVVAVNYFGARDFSHWRAWKASHDCVLVEDHTHDPLGSQAVQSTADYVFSSLRKTLPVPDGAILWSPQKLSLPPNPHVVPHPGALLRAKAMVLKAQYLSGSAPNDSKTVYRSLFSEGEHELESLGGFRPHDDSFAVAGTGIPVAWQKQREANVTHWNRRFSGTALIQTWPAGAIPFASILLLDNRRQRDLYRKELERQRIYCPVHWPSHPGLPEHVRELSHRVLTLPSDQRYDDDSLEQAIERTKSL